MKNHLIIVLTFTYLSLNASHNKAGEITYRQIGEMALEATITTYTRASSPASEDRDSLTLCWGDGLCEMVFRTNGSGGNGEELEGDYRLNVYTGIHTYSEKASYILSMTDPNRDHDILNVNFPFSENVPLHLETTFTLMASEAGSFNSSPMFLQLPVDYAYVGLPFQHIPQAIDAESDSISYRLVTPLQALGTEVESYEAVTDIGPGAGNVISIDSISGEIIWESPRIAGSYVLAVEVSSWRSGILLDKIIRDMQIIVEDVEGVFMAPEILLTGDEEGLIPFSSGETIELEVMVRDSNENESVILTSTSELYENGSATFNVEGGEGSFQWVVQEPDLRKAPYLVVFKAKSDYMETGMTSYKVLVFSNQLPVRVKYLNVSNSFTIAPNPADDYIEIRGEEAYNRRYFIYSIGGKLVDSGRLAPGSFRIDVSKLQRGCYLTMISSEDGHQLSKFVKL